MFRIHPDHGESSKFDRSGAPSRFTFWKKSSMSFQGTDGFMVFDHRGRLVFRVDNYFRNELTSNGIGLVLMDGVGNPLLVLRPRGFNIQCRWDAYRGDCGGLFTIRKRMRPLLSSNDKDEWVDVFLRRSSRGSNHAAIPDFVVEGSFARRNCVIRRNGDGAIVVARIMRKRAKAAPTVVLWDDVFSLVVQPEFDPSLPWDSWWCWIGYVGNLRLRYCVRDYMHFLLNLTTTNCTIKRRIASI